MNTVNRAESPAHFELRRLLLRHGEKVAPAHIWHSERDRWIELVFAILAVNSKTPEYALRGLLNDLSAMGLLEPEAVVDTGWIERCNDEISVHGIEIDSVADGFSTVSEVALLLIQKYDGKVQKLLRTQAEKFLLELQQDLSIRSLGADQQRVTLTYWLQNSLHLPVSLVDTNVKDFSIRRGISINDLIGAADDLDVNVAFLDDLIHEDQRNVSPNPIE